MDGGAVSHCSRSGHAEAGTTEIDGDNGHEEAVYSVAIRSLLPADSPRLEGEERAHVLRLAEVDTPLPPILVHRQAMRVIDGMHRLRAAMLRGEKEIKVTFFDGSESEAFARGVELNITHGLPLTHADRRAAAVRIMAAEPELSDRAVADRTGLAARTVAMLRRSTTQLPQSNRRVGVNGRSWPVDKARGRRQAAEFIAAHPDASLREVAKAAGISLSTAHDVRKRLLQGRDPLPRGLTRVPAHASPRERAAGKDGGRRTVPECGTDSDRSKVLRQLMRDPSLRHSAPGRELLRMLNAQIIPADGWTGLADTVPPHCADAVAGLARETAAAWERFAETLARR